MDSFASIITAFGGPADFARAIGITANHAGVMKSRDYIGSEYWGRTVRAAKRQGVEGVSLETLARIDEARAKARPTQNGTHSENPRVASEHESNPVQNQSNHGCSASKPPLTGAPAE